VNPHSNVFIHITEIHFSVSLFSSVESALKVSKAVSSEHEHYISLRTFSWQFACRSL
jgi:hypothetical protein